MSAFELVDAPPVADCPDSMPQPCQCPYDGQRRDVLVSIDAGQVHIHCPACQLPIEVGEAEDLSAEDVPMLMRTIVEKEPADSWSGFEISAVWHELTAPDGEASA